MAMVAYLLVAAAYASANNLGTMAVGRGAFDCKNIKAGNYQ
jgi:hypothetical protein